MTHLRLPALLFTGTLLGACAAPGTDPQDMSAADHRKAAESHGDEAEQHAAEYDPEAEEDTPAATPAPGEDSWGSYTGQFYASDKYNPTEEHLKQAKRHEAHAVAHAAAAEALESYEEAECKAFPKETRKICPLMGKVVAVEDIDEPAHAAGGPAPHAQQRRRGVRIRFAEGVDMDAVLAHARCHMSYAATHGFEGMDSCPLYIKGTTVRQPDKHAAADQNRPGNPRIGKGGAPSGPLTGNPRMGRFRAEKGAEPHTLDLLVDDEAMLEELRRRAKAHVSDSAH